MENFEPQQIPDSHLEKTQELNALTNLDHTMTVMAELEGERWLERQKTAMHAIFDEGADRQLFQYTVPWAVVYVREQHSSLQRVREKIQKMRDENLSELGGDTLEYLMQNERSVMMRSAEVYGSGGGNRWFMYPDGRVLLSSRHFIPKRGDRELIKKLQIPTT